MMKKATLAFVIIFLLVIPVLLAEQLGLPIAEQECFHEFVESNTNYSIIQGRAANYNTTELDLKEPSVKHIVVNKFSDLCLHTTNPTRCYECITLKKYGIWDEKKNQIGPTENAVNGNNILIITILIIIASGLLVLLISYYKKQKALKQVKKRKH